MKLRPSQCEIKNISITNHDKSVRVDQDHNEFRLLEFIDTIDIHESIFTPYITADVSFIDGANLLEHLNISGNEDFEIDILGYGNDTSLKHSLKVVECTSVLPNSTLRSKSFNLRLSSKELLIDSASTMSKSYAAGTKAIVTDILQGVLGTSKPIFVEDTKDPPVLVIPYLSPFQAIDYVRQRSVSSKYKSSSFLFFETKGQYMFATVEGLAERNASSSERFFQQESISRNVKGNQGTITDIEAYRLFTNLTVSTPFNVSNYFKRGGLQSTITQFDFTTKKYKSRLFQNTPGAGLFNDFAAGKNPDITPTLFNDYSKYQNKAYMLPFALYKDSNNKADNFIYDTLAERLCYSSIFTQRRVYIDIPGNTKIGAGSIVNLEVPRYAAIGSKKNDNEVDSGSYMVASVRHSIKNADTAKYDTHLELLRYGKGVFEK